MKKQVIILAAGGGTRLRSASGGKHKSLMEVGHRRLIEYQMGILASVGIDSVCVVAGCCAGQVRSVVGDRATYITNPDYSQTNSLYSLWLARDWVSGPFALMNCDVLAHPDIYHRVLAVNGSALAYDSSSGSGEEEMKVAVEGGFVKALSKGLPKHQISGENVGILQFDETATELLFAEAASLIALGNENQWAPAAVSGIASRVPIRAVDIAGLSWIEIDFPQDLERARREICPNIPGCSDRSLVEVRIAA